MSKQTHNAECECDVCLREAELQDFLISAKYEDSLHDGCKAFMQKQAADLATLRQQGQRLREAVRKYGTHLECCATCCWCMKHSTRKPRRCDCGYDTTLREGG